MRRWRVYLVEDVALQQLQVGLGVVAGDLHFQALTRDPVRWREMEHQLLVHPDDSMHGVVGSLYACVSLHKQRMHDEMHAQRLATWERMVSMWGLQHAERTRCQR